MNNFKSVAQFLNGLTKEDTAIKTNVSVVNKCVDIDVDIDVVNTIDESQLYREHLHTYIDNRVADIDAEYSYRMHRVSKAYEDDIQLTSFVKGGRL